MAEVTVKQLAETVGAPIDRLLKQMAEAGLPHSGEEETVTEEQKQTLLAFLKTAHGAAEPATKKITLKRKSVSTLRTDRGRGKAVAVEVRKKRTYVKREAAPEVEEAAAPEPEQLSELDKLKAEESQREADRQAAEAQRRADEEARKAESERRAEEAEREKAEAEARAKAEEESKARAEAEAKAAKEAAEARAAVEAERNC